jgi:CBS domain-containing protein
VGARYQLRAQDIMQVELATILDDATVAEAAKMMRAEGVRSLIVEPHDDNDSLGIVSFADMVSKVIAQGHDPEAIRVHQIMTKPAIVIDPTMPVQYIARLIERIQAGHIPVVKDGRVLGMVSMTDLVTEVIADPD